MIASTTARLSSPAEFFAIVGLVGLLLVALGLARSRSGVTPPQIRLPKTTIDGQDVTVINRTQALKMIETLRVPGAAAKLLLDPNSPAWAQLTGALQPQALGADSPFPVIIKVRSALQAQQLDSVRHLLSDGLYQRLSIAPPVPAVAASPQLFMTTNQHPGDDPNRFAVRVGGSVTVPGATAEDWTMVRAAQEMTAGPMAAPTATTSPVDSAATAPAATTPAPPSTCPYCSAQLDPGATRCRFCGMDVTLAMPSTVPAPVPSPTPITQPATTSAGWIVDDIRAAEPMAA